MTPREQPPQQKESRCTSLVACSQKEHISRLIRKGYSNEEIADLLYKGEKFTLGKRDFADGTWDYDFEAFTTGYRRFFEIVADIREQRREDRNSKSGSAESVCGKKLKDKIKRLLRQAGARTNDGG